MRKHSSHNVKTVLYVYRYSYKNCYLVFAEHTKHKDTCIYRNQDVRTEKQEAIINRSKESIGSNHEYLGILKAESGAREIAQKFSWNSVGNMHPVKSILTRTKYLKILIHHIVPSTNPLNPEGFIFQQDYDPKQLVTLLKNTFKIRR